MKIYIALGTYQDYASVLCVKKSLEEVENFLYNNFKVVEKEGNNMYSVENEKYIDSWFVEIIEREV